ncbi:TIGR03088 family PEP-CTERM/XrtA system glycosyltransferase [Pseudoduganella sp. LjRoot289]|uniref:TIGR03088 family PEP-CTERM/XrtA system glycosyltransferase n=1 Tax=Pseudoduganella sp. LjRoot289 TaxID=3342314 RepID=UPI003ECCB711
MSAHHKPEAAPAAMPAAAPAMERRPLVLHVIHHLYIGGMENGLVNLINHMPADRYRHAILCVEDYSDFRLRITRPDVEVMALHRSRIGVWRMRLEMFKLFRRLKPAFIHSRNMSGLDALLPALLAGVPHRIHGEHGWDVHDLDGRAFKPALLRRLHAPLVSRYITVSQDLARYLGRRVGVSGRRISQVYNGVDMARFAPLRDRSALPPGFAGHEAEGTVVIGTVGRAQAVKDQATLLRAFARLVEDEPGLGAALRLVLVGDGPKLRPLQALAQELGIAQQTWFAGASSEVPRMLAALDVFVLPSLSEGISNTILEAMASGLPVLATAVGGNVELVRAGEEGAFFEPGDVAGLARLMGVYSGDAALRRAHGAAARAGALARYSMPAMVSNYMAVYDGLLR